jgi:Right handed beta helix region
MTKSFLAGLASLTLTAGAYAQPTCTPITTVPYTITEPGTYCLTGDLPVTSDAFLNAIEIASDSVTIDLQGHTLDGGTLGPGNQVNGIYSLNRGNITVHNGTIRGFYHGILLDTSDPAASHDLLVENTVVDGSKYRGMRIDGNHTIVRDNLIRDTGYNTTGLHPDGLVTCGEGGTDSVVYNNTVLNVVGDSPDGMELYCFNASAIGNRVINSDKGGLEMRPGTFCKDNIVEYTVRFTWNMSKDPSEACNFVGNTNYAYP